MNNRPPSVDRLIKDLETQSELPHPLLADAARGAIAKVSSESRETPTHQDYIAAALQICEQKKRHLLTEVINATGTLLHTNLGRASWATTQPAAYTNLEFNLETGQRGSRQSHVAALFAKLLDAEAAMVVNNCAAAVTLVLAALANGRGVAVSAGELVEIGGNFRVPEVIEQSGAQLHTVGATNRTRRADYEKAISNPQNDIALVLSVHRSNYKIVGFTEQATTQQLTNLGVPLVCDLGSGLLDAACPWLKNGTPNWLQSEPAAKQTLQQGANLICFSGDKLLGGPQAGIIAGDKKLIEKCAKHPLARAFRPGSLVLSSLQNLALLYLQRQGEQIPFWEMATRTPQELLQRAREIAKQIGAKHLIEATECSSVPGGGTMPETTIPSAGLQINANAVSWLRNVQRPVIARIQDGKTTLDLRTVDPLEDAYITAQLQEWCSQQEQQNQAPQAEQDLNT